MKKRVLNLTQKHLEQRRHGNSSTQLAHPGHPDRLSLFVRHGCQDIDSWTLPRRQPEDGQRWHEEGDRAALDDGQTAAEGGLQPGY